MTPMCSGFQIGIPFVSSSTREQTKCSLYSRIAAAALGAIALVVGILALANVSGICALGMIGGSVLSAVGGILLIIATLLKCGKEGNRSSFPPSIHPERWEESRSVSLDPDASCNRSIVHNSSIAGQGMIDEGAVSDYPYSLPPGYREDGRYESLGEGVTRLNLTQVLNSDERDVQEVLEILKTDIGGRDVESAIRENFDGLMPKVYIDYESSNPGCLWGFLNPLVHSYETFYGRAADLMLDKPLDMTFFRVSTLPDPLQSCPCEAGRFCAFLDGRVSDDFNWNHAGWHHVLFTQALEKKMNGSGEGLPTVEEMLVDPEDLGFYAKKYYYRQIEKVPLNLLEWAKTNEPSQKLHKALEHRKSL